MIDAIRSAIIRLLWKSVADEEECTCHPEDQCALCQAMAALGHGAWYDWESAETVLMMHHGRQGGCGGTTIATRRHRPTSGASK